LRKLTIGFDVYGTLVDPLEISHYLRKLIGDKSILFAEIWRLKQLEYTYRRGLMNRYQDCDVCTQQAMQYVLDYLDIRFSTEEKNNLLNVYKTLPAFPDSIPTLKSLQQSNNILVAFSNGTPSTLKTLLSNAELFNYLEKIVSVDTLQTYKPNPKVYELLASQTGNELSDCWVVSSNPFDVIGAKSAGLLAAWVNRNNTIFDPWEYQPDIIVNNLVEFATHLQ